MKLNWIECNLPYFNLSFNNKLLKYPDYHSVIRKKFGNIIESISIELHKIDPSMIFIKSLPREKNKDYEWMLKNFPEKSDYINKLQEYGKLNDEADKFWELETKDITEKNEKIKNEFKDESFRGFGLDKPGTIVEFSDGSRKLIGDILECGLEDPNFYDEGLFIPRDSIVVRYAKLDLENL